MIDNEEKHGSIFQIFTAGMVTSIAGGLFLFFVGVFKDVSNLKAEIRHQKENNIDVSEKIKSLDSKVSDIHWFLIKRNNIKPPQENK